LFNFEIYDTLFFKIAAYVKYRITPMCDEPDGFLKTAKTRLYCISLLFFFLSACFPSEQPSQKTFKDDANVIIYLEPMPQEASKLRFIIDEIAVINDDGLKTPLSLSFYELKGSELAGKQKLLASGFVTPGAYTGISIKVTKAFLQGEEGESSLFVSEEPVTVTRFFKVLQRKALALFLTFSPSGAKTRGFRFTPDFSLAVSGRELTSLTGYVTNSGSNIISVFNKKTMRITGTISTGRGPMGMVLNQKLRRAYVAASGDDAIEVIDVIDGKIIGRIILDFGDEPVELALTPDGRTLVAVNRGSNTVSIIDAFSEFEVRKIKVGARPASAVVDPLGFKAYIMNSLSNTISVVDLSQNVISVNIGIEGAPIRGVFNRNGDKLYVISTDSPYLSVIDPGRLIVTDKAFIGLGAVSIQFDIRTGLILVCKQAENKIEVIEPFSLAVIDSIDTGGNAAFIKIEYEENVLFAAFPGSKTVQKINLVSKKNVAEIEVGEAAHTIVVMGER
jgi:YVTN family beta-propeller protein